MNKKGEINLLELIIIILICIELFFVAKSALGWSNNKVSSGNDALTLNTCESVAKVNSLDGYDCPVNDCAKGEMCTHKVGNYYVGYYDNVSNTIVGNKVSGYNSGSNPTIDGKSFIGNPGTMIIKVTCGNGTITYEWVSSND